jgi:hypothetical protein
MGGRYIGAYFFIPLDKRPATDDELFAKLGEQPNGYFGPLIITERNVTVLSEHVCAQLYFWANSLFDLRFSVRDEPLTLERDPALPFAYAIRDGAMAVGASVVILETHNAELERILDRYWMVLVNDATALAVEWFSLLHLSDELVEDWSPPPHLLDRDELPGGPGRTLFGGRGRTRWA